MTVASDAAAPGVEREALRARLRTQRRLLARWLPPARTEPAAFPRSITMRLLMQRPPVARGLLARAVVLLLCSRELRAFVLAPIRRLAARVPSSRR